MTNLRTALRAQQGALYEGFQIRAIKPVHQINPDQNIERLAALLSSDTDIHHIIRDQVLTSQGDYSGLITIQLLGKRIGQIPLDVLWEQRVTILTSSAADVIEDCMRIIAASVNDVRNGAVTFSTSIAWLLGCIALAIGAEIAPTRLFLALAAGIAGTALTGHPPGTPMEVFVQAQVRGNVIGLMIAMGLWANTDSLGLDTSTPNRTFAIVTAGLTLSGLAGELSSQYHALRVRGVQFAMI